MVFDMEDNRYGSINDRYQNPYAQGNSFEGSSQRYDGNSLTTPLKAKSQGHRYSRSTSSWRMEIPPAPPSPSRTGVFVYSLAAVCAYLALGVLVYCLKSNMAVLDALYFCVVTLTTVGYGDLSAHTSSTKLFACFYILLGAAMIGTLLSALVELLLTEQEELMMKVLQKSKLASPAELGNVQGDGPGVYVMKKLKLKPRQMKVLSSVTTFVLLTIAASMIFRTEDGLSFVDAFYLTVVSVSTVGYGDYHPVSTVGKVFCVFFLPVATLLLAKIVSDYTEMIMQAKTEASQQRILMATITPEDFEDMDENEDGRISPMEFLCRTLVAQEKVTHEDIQAIKDRFNELDRSRDGFINRDEIGACRDRNGDGFITSQEL